MFGSLINRDPFNNFLSPDPIFSEFDPMLSLGMGYDQGNRGTNVRATTWGNRSDANCDVYEKENAYVLTCELAGVRKEDIDISIDGQVISVTFTKQPPQCCAAAVDTATTGSVGSNISQAQRTDWNYLVNERKLRKCCRGFRLPSNCDMNHGTPSFVDGLLIVEFPKLAPSATHRKLQILGNVQGK